MGKDAKLTTFTLASDYAPMHYNWTENELFALGDCKATAEVIKKRLEENGTKIKEMYVIQHKGEEKADSKSEKHHIGTDETKLHYHILVKFEDEQGAPLKKIAKYIGVRPEIIEKLKPGGHSYYNVLAYLIHIKYKNKFQYTPQEVATLAGTDYTAHYDKHIESWKKARDIVAEMGGKTLDRRFREAVKKLESGELSYAELFGIPEYHDLPPKGKYHLKLKAAAKRAEETAEYDFFRLCKEICNGKISKEEAKTLKEYKYAFKYYDDSHIDSMVLSMKGYQK